MVWCNNECNNSKITESDAVQAQTRWCEMTIGLHLGDMMVVLGCVKEVMVVFGANIHHRTNL